MNTAMTGPRAVALAALLVGALAPVMLTAPSGAAGSCDHTIAPHTVPGGQGRENIQASTPLSEEFSVSQILAMVAMDGPQTPYQDRQNGIDAYVHDLGCSSHNLKFVLNTWTGDDLTDQNEQADMAVQFYDANFEFLGQVSEDADDDELLEGDVHDRTRYMVVVMEDGPLISGIDYDEFPPESYSVQFRMKIV